MDKKLNGKKIAILIANGFEEIEMTEPRKALEENGAITYIVSPEHSHVRAFKHGNWSTEFKVNVPIDDADGRDYDALLLPGGVINPDRLRRNRKAIDFVTHFFNEGKIIAAICHAPSLLIETNLLKGRKLTSFYSIKTDLINAGADWKDKDVVVDGNLITSRNPPDITAFNEKIIEELSSYIPA